MAGLSAASSPSSSPLDLQGRVAIVTGGSRGIGKEVCLNLARHGASVVVCYQGSASAANDVVSVIQQQGIGTAIPFQCDVANPSDVSALFDAAVAAYGQINIVVHLAGITLASYPSIESTSFEDWQNVMSVNVTGTFLVCKEAASRITPGGKGRIVTTSTSLVVLLRTGYGAYVASKAAVESFTKILAKELKGKKITANCVAPGPVATELFFAGKDEAAVQMMREMAPLGRLGEPHDIASVVHFLVSDGGEWVNGQVIRANGGAII